MGKLILLNSGIGDIGDLSEKARDSLRTGQYFAVEDTRKFKQLLGRLGIAYGNKVIESYHDFSSAAKLQQLLNWAKEREVYVASDAGSPVICDPAFPLVQLALNSGVEVATISGVSSILYALELSGLPSHPFTFWGFLSRSPSLRTELINNLSRGTHIFLESPRRLLSSLQQLTDQCPESPFVVAKELSKTHQRVHRFLGKEFAEVRESIDARGEFVLLLHRHRTQGLDLDQGQLRSLAQAILDQGLKPKPVAKLVAKLLQADAKVIYQQLIR